MNCNEDALDIIRRHEGLRLKRYLCPAGKPSIGYGHVLKSNEKFTTITEDQAEALLRKDVQTAENAIWRMVSVPLNENQYSALVSFIFNVGSTNFRTSTMRALINKKAWLEASAEFPKWNKARIDGKLKTLGGLTARRAEERALFLRPVLVIS